MIPELAQAIGHGPVHFIGIGGISMSGLARILLDQGIPVTGSDRVDSPVIHALRARGARIGVPHNPDLVGGQTLVVHTAAISDDNPELLAARAQGMTIMDRGHFLGLLARGYRRTLAISGTHGKTTSTGMTACVLLAADTDPTIQIGGMLPAIGGNTRSGSNGWFLMEACEYKNSYHSFHPTHALILNIEADHLDFFKDLDDVLASFARFTENIADNGTLVLNLDDAGCLALANRLKRPWCGYRVLESTMGAPTETPPESSAIGTAAAMDGTSGADIPAAPASKNPTASAPQALYEARHVRMENGLPVFDVHVDKVRMATVRLNVPGAHNVQNALGCFALTHRAGISPQVIANGLSAFTGTGRRFEFRGLVNGARLYDDYAHHPSEIRATLATARQMTGGRILCVFQPHTYTRTRELLKDFSAALIRADQCVVVDIYAAREPDLGQVHARDLVQAIRERGGNATYADSFAAAAQLARQQAAPEDVLLVMGAGDIAALPDLLLSPDL